MFQISLGVRVSPIRIKIPNSRFSARAEPAFGGAFEIGLEELGADDHARLPPGSPHPAAPAILKTGQIREDRVSNSRFAGFVIPSRIESTAPEVIGPHERPLWVQAV